MVYRTSPDKKHIKHIYFPFDVGVLSFSGSVADKGKFLLFPYDEKIEKPSSSWYVAPSDYARSCFEIKENDGSIKLVFNYFLGYDERKNKKNPTIKYSYGNAVFGLHSKRVMSVHAYDERNLLSLFQEMILSAPIPYYRERVVSPIRCYLCSKYKNFKTRKVKNDIA